MRWDNTQLVRQRHTLGAAIEALERRLVLDADLAPWVQEYMQPYQDEEEADPGPPSDAPPQSPVPSGLFEGVDSKTNLQTYLGLDPVPPDPSIAVGPGHVVATVNSTIRWWTKSGTVQNTQNLGTGFGTAFFAPLNPVDLTSDSKVIYDQYANRFVVEAIEVVDTPTTLNSRVLLAVSDDSDPNGTWYFASIDTKMFINNADRWLDYPTLGIDSQAIYIAGNMFGFNNNPFGQNQFVGTRLIILDKSGLYSGGAATSNIYDPSVLAGRSSDLFTLQPAHMYGAAPAGMGTFLVASGLADFNGNDFLGIIKITNPLSSPTFTYNEVALGNITVESGFLPEAPQPGTTTNIAVNDQRLINAVWRNNSLWTTNEIKPLFGVNANQTTAHWYQITADGTNAPTVAQQGDAGGEDVATGAYTYMPSINVNAAGDMAMQFTLSSSTTYAGAYYVARQASDPLNEVQSTALLAAGQDTYVKTNSGTINRWGDFSATEVDPADDTTFWLYGEYALPKEAYNPGHAGQTGHWGTRAAAFSFVGTLGISGQLYTDANDNGILDAGEATLNGVNIYLDNNNNGTLDVSEPVYTTGGNGYYVFTGLANGVYHVRQVKPVSYIQSTAPADVTISTAPVTLNIGDFPTSFPVAGNLGTTPRSFSVGLAIGGTIEQVTDAGITYNIAKSALTGIFLSFTGGPNDDTFTVSFANGTPEGKINFDGGFQATGDSFNLIGSAGADTVTFNASTFSVVCGISMIAFRVERFSFDGTGGGDNLSIVGDNVDLAASQDLASLSLSGSGASARLTSGGNKVLITSALSIASGTSLDLTDNDAILRNGNLPAIQNLVSSAYNSGAWNGTTGITSSAAAAASGSANKTALGYGLASSTALSSPFDGQTLSPFDVVIRYTNPGDANLDGAVNNQDFIRLAQNFAGGSKTWADGEFSFDGTVNAIDFNSIATNFGQVLAAPTLSRPFSGVPIPEPAQAKPVPSLWERDSVASMDLQSNLV